MRPPAELVLAGAASLSAGRFGAHRESIALTVLAHVPDGWAKLDGRWVRLYAAEDGIGDPCYYEVEEAVE